MARFKVEKVDKEKNLAHIIDNGLSKPVGITNVKPYNREHTTFKEIIENISSALLYARRAEEADNIFLAEVLDPYNNRSKTPEMADTKNAENQNLLNRGNFKVLLE